MTKLPLWGWIVLAIIVGIAIGWGISASVGKKGFQLGVGPT